MTSDLIQYSPMTEAIATPEIYLPQKELIIAGDRGPCGGVNMAIDTTFQVLDLVNGRKPVYANNPPVHNDLILDEFKSRGLLIEPDLDNIPDESILLLSAHGTPPSLTETAKLKGIIVVNAECQYVSKVRRRAEGAITKVEHVIYFGAEGHPEPKAVLADLPADAITFVNIHDQAAPILPHHGKIRVLNQTTLSTNEISKRKNLLEKETNTDLPDPIGICYATDNRQRAVREGIFGNPSKPIDRLVVVGSKTSHNSKELRNIGNETLGENYSYLVNGPQDLDEDQFRDATRVGLTSGASVMDKYTEPVIRWFKEKGYRLTFLQGTERELFFKGPSLEELKTHLAGLN